MCSRECAAVANRGPRVSEEWTKLRQAWRGILARCYDSRFSYYAYYGERGISVCREWRTSFQSFYDWSIASGYVLGLEIDRRDVNGDYEPSNCRWATRCEQMRNTRKRRNAKTSKYRGVSWCANVGKWRAQICGTSRNSNHIGLYVTEVDAAIAYDEVAAVEFGEFASLNFPRKECAAF